MSAAQMYLCLSLRAICWPFLVKRRTIKFFSAYHSYDSQLLLRMNRNFCTCLPADDPPGHQAAEEPVPEAIRRLLRPAGIDKQLICHTGAARHRPTVPPLPLHLILPGMPLSLGAGATGSPACTSRGGLHTWSSSTAIRCSPGRS